MSFALPLMLLQFLVLLPPPMPLVLKRLLLIPMVLLLMDKLIPYQLSFLPPTLLYSIYFELFSRTRFRLDLGALSCLFSEASRPDGKH